MLDVACGPGNTTRQLLPPVGSDGLVVGVDSAASMLAQAVLSTDADAPAGYVRADAADLPFADAIFDAVSCYGALYLMDEPAAALTEMMRMLKPGGRIAVLHLRQGSAAIAAAQRGRIQAGLPATLRPRGGHRSLSPRRSRRHLAHRARDVAGRRGASPVTTS